MNYLKQLQAKLEEARFRIREALNNHFPSRLPDDWISTDACPHGSPPTETCPICEKEE